MNQRDHWRFGGGCRHDRLPAYATGGPSNYPLARLAEKADYYLSLGFRGLIDELVMFRRALTAGEIGRLMDVTSFQAAR